MVIFLPKELKTINRLYERMMTKKNHIFDISIYCKILNENIDFSYVPEIKEKENHSIILKIDKVEKLPVKKVKKSKKIVEQVGKSQNRYVNHSESVKLERTSNETREILLKDLFYQEIVTIQKYIYLKMNNVESQMRAIKAWDNFENLIYKKQVMLKLIIAFYIL